MTTERTWLGRVGVLLAIWLAVCGLLVWLGSDPSWVGLLAAASAVAGFAWLISDVSPTLALTTWVTDHRETSRQPALDGRLAVLRRLVEMAAQPPRDGLQTRPSAVEMQNLLRAATKQRLSARPDAELPHDLAEYLQTSPAPLVTPDHLDRLLTRIEAL